MRSGRGREGLPGWEPLGAIACVRGPGRAQHRPGHGAGPGLGAVGRVLEEGELARKAALMETRGREERAGQAGGAENEGVGRL